jgi:CRP-like cAMP-binding protein
LAFQGVLSNILSGISLHFNKSFSKGDWVEVGEHEGVVLDTNWRETRIFDRFSNIIVIPNNMMASEKITNFSAPNKKTAIPIPIKTSYDAPPAAVFEALREAALDMPEVLRVPKPEIQLLGYDDFGINYLLKFWINDYAKKFVIMAEVGRNIWYKFKRRNIDIPIPLSDKLEKVFKTVKDKERIFAAEQEIEKTFYDLQGSSFLRHPEGEKAGELLLSNEEIRGLAAYVQRHKYAPGEVLFRQGDLGESCFVVAKGAIKGEITTEEKGEKYTSDFKVEAGGIFGEMSLFTGMPRTATGIVGAESELLEIRAEAFAQLLEQNPALAEIIAEIVSKRNEKNREFLKKIKELSAQDIEDSISKHTILNRLKMLIRRKS